MDTGCLGQRAAPSVTPLVPQDPVLEVTAVGEFYDRFRSITAASGREVDGLDPGEASA